MPIFMFLVLRYTCKSVYAHVYAHVCTHLYTHVYTHVHTHVRTLKVCGRRRPREGGFLPRRSSSHAAR